MVDEKESLNKLLSVLIKGQEQNRVNITATAELVVMQADRITFLEKQNELLLKKIADMETNPLNIKVHSLGDVLKLS